jgi:hypothetical protein
MFLRKHWHINFHTSKLAFSFCTGMSQCDEKCTISVPRMIQITIASESESKPKLRGSALALEMLRSFFTKPHFTLLTHFLSVAFATASSISIAKAISIELFVCET